MGDPDSDDIDGAAVRFLGLTLLMFASAFAAQGPALIDAPRIMVITIIPTHDAQGNVTSIVVTTTVSVLEAAPSGSVERQLRSFDINLTATAGKEVGTGRSKTNHGDIGKDVLLMVTQEAAARFIPPPPLPTTPNVQSGRSATRTP